MNWEFVKTFFLTLFIQICFLSYAHADDMPYGFTSMEKLIEKSFIESDNFASCSIKKINMKKAHSFYYAAERKLTDVNNWANLIGVSGQDFHLYSGRTRLYRLANKGDLIRIILPLDPTNRSYWVKIESIKRSNEKNGMKISIVVRPTANPFKNRNGTDIIDHFFTNEATNTFSVTLKGAGIVVRAAGRGEVANTSQAATQADAVANYTISQMGWGVEIDHRQTGFQSFVWARFNKAIAVCE